MHGRVIHDKTFSVLAQLAHHTKERYCEQPVPLAVQWCEIVQLLGSLVVSELVHAVAEVVRVDGSTMTSCILRSSFLS